MGRVDEKRAREIVNAFKSGAYGGELHVAILAAVREHEEGLMEEVCATCGAPYGTCNWPSDLPTIRAEYERRHREPHG